MNSTESGSPNSTESGLLVTRVVNVREFRVGRRYVLPADVVYIGRQARGMPRSPFANPFRIGEPIWSAFDYESPRPPRIHDRQTVVAEYWRWLADKVARGELDPEPLRGRRLACWCAPARCHGDVIREWLAEHPPVVAPGEPIVFGLHVQPVADATMAPAWPPASVVRARARGQTRARLRAAV